MAEYVTTQGCCSKCGAKLENAETSRRNWQAEAHRLFLSLHQLRDIAENANWHKCSDHTWPEFRAVQLINTTLAASANSEI